MTDYLSNVGNSFIFFSPKKRERDEKIFGVLLNVFEHCKSAVQRPRRSSKFKYLLPK